MTLPTATEKQLGDIKNLIIYTAHTYPFNSPLSGTTQVNRYKKGTINLDFTETRDSEWQWHQLGQMQSAPRSRQITTPAPHHSVFYRPDALPVSLPQWHTVGSTDVCSVCVWQAVDASGTPLCLHCHTPYQSSLIDKSSVDQNPWLTRLCSRQCMQQFWVVMHVSCSLQSACVKCNLWTFNRLTPGLWKYWNLKPANLRSSKSLNVKVLFESAWKVLECDLLVFLKILIG